MLETSIESDDGHKIDIERVGGEIEERDEPILFDTAHHRNFLESFLYKEKGLIRHLTNERSSQHH
eukprot:scaffold13135_cov110-Skeletonema_dohrnii-CCMP3373.AAC.2